ncbi:unnamed protein product, partial [Prorocentrum cordatum]
YLSLSPSSLYPPPPPLLPRSYLKIKAAPTLQLIFSPAMKTFQAAATVALLLVGATPTQAAADGQNPLGKVLELLGSLAVKVASEGEAEQKAFVEYTNWCDDAASNKRNDIKTGETKKGDLEASIGKLTSDIAVSEGKIEELVKSIATQTKDLTDATAIRKKEASEFSANEAELMDSIDTLGRAISIISKEMAKNPAAFTQLDTSSFKSLMKGLTAVMEAASFTAASKQKLTALVQAGQSSDSDEDPMGAPAATVYKTHSSDILDLLEDLKEKAEEDLAALRKAETNTKQNFEMLEQSLTDANDNDNKDMVDEKAAKSAAEEEKAADTKDLEMTIKALTDANSVLESIKSDCMQVAADHEVTVAGRNAELKAIADAKKILEDTTSGAVAQSYSLVQLSAGRSRMRTSADLKQAEVVTAVQQLARALPSQARGQSRFAAWARYSCRLFTGTLAVQRGALAAAIARSVMSKCGAGGLVGKPAVAGAAIAAPANAVTDSGPPQQARGELAHGCRRLFIDRGGQPSSHLTGVPREGTVAVQRGALAAAIARSVMSKCGAGGRGEWMGDDGNRGDWLMRACRACNGCDGLGATQAGRRSVPQVCRRGMTGVQVWTESRITCNAAGHCPGGKHACWPFATVALLLTPLGDAFVAWLAALPEKIEREEVNFPEERRKAIFKHLDSAKTGSITLENFKDMFKRRFTCVKQISVTDVFEIAKSKTTSKIEPGEVLESTGMAGARADEGGMTRIECRIVSSGAVGFVTVKGNEGTKYLDEVTAFSAFTVGMDKALAEASKAINKASGFLSQKAKELSASTPGPLAEARAELLKLRPKVTSASQSLDTMKRKTVLAKAAFVKREAEERNAHIVAKEKKEADAVLAVARAKVDPMEACARKLEEAAAPVLAAGSELEAFPTPAAALQDVMQLFNDVTGCVGEAKACLKEETEKIRKVLKGPILDAQRELKKMQMRCETLAKECKGTVDKVKKACSTISAAKSALISTAMRAEVQKRGITVEALFDELAASSDRISEEAFCKHASAAVDGAALQPEHVLLVARGIEADGAGKLPSGAEAAGISRRRFVAFVQRYYTVVKPIAITDVLDVTKGKTRRKAEVNEVIEVLEGPCVDEKLKMSRIRGKALSDSVEGWISVQGNQGTPFLTEAQKPYYCCTAGAPLEKDFQTTEPPVRELRPDEIVELLEGPKKEAFAPALRARGKACKDQAQGWFTARDKKGTVMAEADAKYYSCVTSVAMTDELDVKSCKVVRKLAVGELFVVTEGPVEEKEAGITRIKGKALKDEAEGWITSKGNAGTVYAEPSKKHWSIVQEQPMTKAFKSNGPVEEVRSLEAGEAVLLLEGPKEEAFPPDVRIKGRALSDGAIGWITLKGTTVKKWSLFYKVLKSGPAHDARSPEGAQVLRETTAGEVAEWLEGPVEEGKELRIKAKLQKDGVIGWVSVRDAEGNKLMENAA